MLLEEWEPPLPVQVFQLNVSKDHYYSQSFNLWIESNSAWYILELERGKRI